MGEPARQNEVAVFQVDRSEIGRADSLQYNVIVFVAEENYDRAIVELKKFLEKESEFPNFRSKIERYILYAIDLVNAIRAKRKFPGIHSLTMAKQHEINDRFQEHFNELKHVLKKIDRIELDLRLQDIRSTVLVIRAMVWAVLAIVALLFVMEGAKGLVSNFFVVLDDYYSQIADFLFRKL